MSRVRSALGSAVDLIDTIDPSAPSLPAAGGLGRSRASFFSSKQRIFSATCCRDSRSIARLVDLPCPPSQEDPGFDREVHRFPRPGALPGGRLEGGCPVEDVEFSIRGVDGEKARRFWYTRVAFTITLPWCGLEHATRQWSIQAMTRYFLLISSGKADLRAHGTSVSRGRNTSGSCRLPCYIASATEVRAYDGRGRGSSDCSRCTGTVARSMMRVCRTRPLPRRRRCGGRCSWSRASSPEVLPLAVYDAPLPPD